MTRTAELHSAGDPRFEHTPPSDRARSAILIVDDDPTVARSLRRVLEAHHFQVVIASDGQAAVELLKEGRFDVILTDIQMPRMTGVDLLTIVRAYDLDVPVLLMTGEPKLETAIEAVSLGALQYLTKPIEKDVLLAAVGKASQLHRMARVKRDALKLVGTGDMEAGDRAGLAARFDRALETLAIAFQPIVEPARRTLYGYEALVRPRERSMASPSAILAAAERLERLPQLGRRIRELSAAAFDAAPAGALLFVNLHTRDLLDADLFRADAPLSAHAARVVLEVTERSTLDDVRDVQARVRKLRDLGFRIAIDDLGAGYAGLSSFAALEPDIVKLDMSLIRDVHLSQIRQRIVGKMASLCKEMGMRVVAEGVESAEERDAAQRLGCELLQGYLYARPGPPFPVVEWNGSSEKSGAAD
jgi:EAL domain-containing protein (putative c-di-GMP-specific phosphodiesterase class I)/CheY-like chemotaxis protein